jgi:hypothetical protein
LQDGFVTTGFLKRGGALAFLIGCAILFTPSFASAGWSAPTTVSGAGASTSQVRIAGRPDGDSWVIWKRAVAGFDVIEGTQVSIDGTQGPIVTISGPSLQATDPVIALRADGSGIVAWLNTAATAATVQSRSIAADGTLGPIVTRAGVGLPGQPAADISVALGDDGTSGIAWRKFNGTNWVVQAVKVAADGTSGAIHNLSESSVSVGPPDIGAAPPVTPDTAYSYRVAWPQGSGATSDLGTRMINSDDSLGEISLLLTGLNEDPCDAQVGYGSDGTLTLAWIGHREDTHLEGPVGSEVSIPYYNWAVQYVQATAGSEPSGALSKAATPTVYGTTYDTSALTLSQRDGAQPVIAWTHDLNGGGQQIVTGRFPSSTTFQGWVNTTTPAPSVVYTALSANA